MARDSFQWLDVERIAEELALAHPSRDPFAVAFPELRRLVEALPGFEPRAEHPVNERILETIQTLWEQERDGDAPDDE